MARGVNKVMLIGNLGQDPEIRYLPNGNAVANVSLATSDSWKDRETGQLQERTEWHKVCFFGKPAEIVGQYARKGSKLYVEGSLRTRKWQDNQGQDRYTTEIVVDLKGQFQLLDGRPEGQPAGAPQPNQAPANPPLNDRRGGRPSSGNYQDPQGYRAPAQHAGGFDDFGSDDIPF